MQYYKSKFKGAQIDANLELAASAVQPAQLERVDEKVSNIATIEDIDAIFDKGGGGGSGSGSTPTPPSPTLNGVHFVGFSAYESQVGDSGTVNLVGVTFAEILANPESFTYYDDHGNELPVQTTEDVGVDYVDLAFENRVGTGQFSGGMHITESSWTWTW